MTKAIAATFATAFLTLAACSQAPVEAPAVTNSAWTLDGDASELSYVTVKQGDIAEVNTFESLSGSVSDSGEAIIEVDLASVSTGVDIRDERMRDIFFVVADNPKATVTAQVDPAAFEALGVGESLQTTLDTTVSVKGVETSFDAEVTVTRAGDDRVIAVTDKPVVIYADSLELGAGLAQLQELAGLDSITPAVPVTFSIAFER
ncbi:MAG: YceI family protein [Pseudomonadota bacterium]